MYKKPGLQAKTWGQETIVSDGKQTEKKKATSLPTEMQPEGNLHIKSYKRNNPTYDMEWEMGDVGRVVAVVSLQGEESIN